MGNSLECDNMQGDIGSNCEEEPDSPKLVGLEAEIAESGKGCLISYHANQSSLQTRTVFRLGSLYEIKYFEK